MKYQVYHTAGFDTGSVDTAFATGNIETSAVRSADELAVGEHPTVLLLEASAHEGFPATALQSFVDAGGAIVVLADLEDHDIPDGIPERLVSILLRHPVRPKELLISIRTGLRDAAIRTENGRLRARANARTKELKEMTQIGVALNTERDYDTLQTMILSQARRISSADAGSLYLVDEPEPGTKVLRFRLAQNHSRPDIPLVEFTIPIDETSIAGYVASTGRPLVLDDAYVLPPGVEYSINRSFDERHGYRTKSLLTIPMLNHKNQVIGVLQLINRKRDPDTKLGTPEDFASNVVPFTRRTVELVSGLAGQAAVSIENSQLYEDIERLFEGFVTAAVTAIEQRDPTTFGHSGRVAEMTVAIAQATDHVRTGKHKDLRFTREQLREIRYAGLLHDFGKVGVREEVLVKSKKLYPLELRLVKHRAAFIRRSAERDFYKQRTEHLERYGKQGYEAFLTRMANEYEERIESLDKFLSLVLESNEPTVLPDGSFDELLKYADVHYEDLDGSSRPFLTGDEVRYLTIRKGNLDETERMEIENHVNHTYRFLMQIPWTHELQNIPQIAYGHHEKLDGGGYPRGVCGDQIPIQTRMMTISDIFDALTASDRPYKRAIPAESALEILESEVESGLLDGDLFQIFHQAEIYKFGED
ncbi:MAG: GAF domain-containing protein [Gemmatimonadetes bacterium]|nr:GAF domain-containing protein [Gemmatimonadota bacterium]